MSNEQIAQIVIISLIGIVGVALLIVIAIAVVGALKNKGNKPANSQKNNASKTSTNTNTNGASKKQANIEQIKKESIFKFMDFDDITDNMIVRKDKKEFVMVLQCKGINFDLMSENEKIAVEEGFIQFLNTLRYPIQLYVQTRSLDLTTGINEYRERTDELERQITKLQEQAREEEKNGNMDKAEVLRYQERSKRNVLEYGQDIINYIARMSQNKNVLQQRTYIIIKYSKADLGEVELSEEEALGLIFSELYTRAQTLSSAIYSTGVEARVLNSEELVELLYVAYNRDDADLINFQKAIEMQYDALYVTGEDILEKKKKAIENQIKEEAMDLTSQAIVTSNLKLSIEKADDDKKEEVLKVALETLKQYKDQFDEVLYNSSIVELFQMANVKYNGEDNQAQETEENIDDTEILEDEKDEATTTSTKKVVRKRKIKSTNE